MIYIMVLVISLIITRMWIDRELFIQMKSLKIFKLVFIPYTVLILFWTFIIGFQDGVGTDYETYKNIFLYNYGLDHYFQKKEYIFYYCVKLLKKITNNPQSLFLTFAFFQSLYMVKILKKLKEINFINNISLFLFLYFTMISLFFQQMNTLRSMLAAIILCYILLCFLEKKKKWILLLLLLFPFTIHRGSIFAVAIISIIFFTKKIQTKAMLTIFIFIVFIGFQGNMFTGILRKIVEVIPMFNHYIDRDVLEPMTINTGLGILIVTIFYIYSIFSFKSSDSNKIFLFNLGIVSYGMKLISLNVTIVNRFIEFFWIFLIFPIYFILEKKQPNKMDKFYKIIVITYYLIIFLKSVLVNPISEKLYKSILF